VVPAGSWAWSIPALRKKNINIVRIEIWWGRNDMPLIVWCAAFDMVVPPPPYLVSKVFENKTFGLDLGPALSAEARPGMAGLQ